MSDPMTPEVKDWMKRTDAEPPDAHQSARQVRARLPEVRQRRRWWPFPVFYRKPGSPSTEQPTSTPAMHGQTPTIIGRTTSMISPVKAITAGALVFAIGGTFLIAQPFQQSNTVPGAEGDEATTEPMPPAIVSGGMVDWGEGTYMDETEAIEDGVNRRRGLRFEGARFEMDDPRLSGDVTYEHVSDWHWEDESEGSGGALFGTIWRIENDEGSWSSSCHSLQVMGPAPDPIVSSCLYTGAGAYDGLSAYLVKELYAGELPYPIKGLIFEGDLPPFPEMPSAE